MMFTELNASEYDYNKSFYNSEFEDILSKIVLCYNLMLSSNIILNNDENKIRDVLYLDYLNSNVVRKEIGLLDYYFDREVSEDRTKGRTDIRILTANSFEDTDAYYILECKRLNIVNTMGNTGLNARYIIDGICRFASNAYSCYYQTNGMLAFIVEKMDIDKNVQCINELLKTRFRQANTTQALTKRDIAKGFDFSYYSFHQTGHNKILIYHLMLDFSNNIKIKTDN